MTAFILALLGKLGLNALPKWAVSAIEIAVLAVVGLGAFFIAWAIFAHHYEAKGKADQARADLAVITGLRNDLKQCHDNTDALVKSVADQNAAVTAWKRDSDAVTASAGKASLSASQAAGAARAAANAVLAVKPPSLAATDPQTELALCRAAMGVRVK